MSSMIQIRNVPERMHRELMRRARATPVVDAAAVVEYLPGKEQPVPSTNMFYLLQTVRIWHIAQSLAWR